MTRSLGDLWSIAKDKEYVISPIPYVSIHHLDLTKDKYIILASDGFWNMVNPQMSVKLVQQLCEGDVKNPREAREVADALVIHAKQEWHKMKLRADNVSVVIIFINKMHTAEDSTLRYVEESAESF